jgi:uncharacterized cupredoxin-like copper-binding protein
MGTKHAGMAAGALVLLVGVVMGVAGCGSDDKSGSGSDTTTTVVAEPVVAAKPDREIQFVATDYAFAGPKTTEAGPVVMTLINNGRVEHQLGLFRMNAGVEASTVLGALAATHSLESTKPFGTWIAGPNGAAVGSRASVVTDLAAGKYIVACLIPAADGQPHALKGMLTQLVVTPAATGSTTPTTASDSDLPHIQLSEYHFALPDNFTGKGTVVVENRGKEVHEMVVARLKPGKTVNDIIAYEKQGFPRTGEAPTDDVAGTTFLSPGQVARLDLDLESGDYAMVCYLPGPDNQAHVVLGMVYPFTVK